MSAIKFIDVIGFRTEDSKFSTANLLQGGKWLSEKGSKSSVNDVTLRLEKVSIISAIDIGNCGSAFVSVEVSRVGLGRYEMLLPSTSLMSRKDCQKKDNWTCVQMFTKEQFSPGVREQKWDLLRVMCMQPFLLEGQFGLSFIKAFSYIERDLSSLRSISPPPGSVFSKRFEGTTPEEARVPLSRTEQLVQAAKGTKCREPAARSSLLPRLSRSGREEDALHIGESSVERPQANQVSTNVLRKQHRVTQHTSFTDNPDVAHTSANNSREMNNFERTSASTSSPYLQRPSPSSSPSLTHSILKGTPKSRTKPSLSGSKTIGAHCSKQNMKEAQKRIVNSKNDRHSCRALVLEEKKSKEDNTPKVNPVISLESDSDSDCSTVIFPLQRARNVTSKEKPFKRKEDSLLSASHNLNNHHTRSEMSFHVNHETRGTECLDTSTFKDRHEKSSSKAMSEGQKGVKRSEKKSIKRKKSPDPSASVAELDSDSDSSTVTISREPATVVIASRQPAGQEKIQSRLSPPPGNRTFPVASKRRRNSKRREQPVTKERHLFDEDIVAVPSSPESFHSTATDIIVHDSESETELGCKQSRCPLCLEFFKDSEIEQHAAGCNSSETDTGVSG